MAISKIGSNSLNSALTFTGQQTIPTINLTGGQITFPATAVPSSDANTLDDYEEGTWTPQLQFGGATTGITYNTQSGTYIKIGKQVIAYAYIYLSSKGSATGNATLNGLPFTSALAGTYGVGVVGYNYSLANAVIWLCRVQDNSTYVILSKGNIAADATQTSNSDYNNNSLIQITCIYQAAS